MVLVAFQPNSLKMISKSAKSNCWRATKIPSENKITAMPYSAPTGDRNPKLLSMAIPSRIPNSVTLNSPFGVPEVQSTNPQRTKATLWSFLTKIVEEMNTTRPKSSKLQRKDLRTFPSKETEQRPECKPGRGLLYEGAKAKPRRENFMHVPWPSSTTVQG